jgi:CubicO group peptidase (beta-lactamase class C family)
MSYTPLLSASDDLLDAGRTTTIDFLLERAIAQGLIAGGVVVIGNHAGVLHSTARGRVTAAPEGALLDEHTLFDLASLTKVLATTPAVMKLLEEGRISLVAPVTRWFPEFEGSGQEDITILNLMTHTSGLHDIDIPSAAPVATVIREVATQKTWRQPGQHFHYADINFILLGELVQRVSGSRLDAFCVQHIYAPLGLNETMFLPPPQLSASIAPTLTDAQQLVSGVVQDANARNLGGIAGHAGLFSSAYDMARFARLILCGGILDGHRIFSERTVAQMTAPYFYSNGKIVRGLGWDITSPYSTPRGSYFSEMSFGHTGYSGSSLWIDPQRDLFVIVLTIRLDYRNIRQFNRLRGDISTLAVAAFHNAPPARANGARQPGL